MGTAPSTIFAKITFSNSAQALALGSTVGAIASVLFNMIRFQRWGLSFTDIATTSDIVMSGITVALALIKMAITLITGVFLCEIVITVVSWLVTRFAVSKKDVADRVSVNLVLAALLVSATVFIIMKWSMLNDISSLSVGVALLGGLVLGSFLNLLLFSRHKHFIIKDRYLRFIPAIWIVLAAIAGVKLQMQQTEENPLRWISPNNFCLGAPVVVWVGSASVVSRCSTSAEAFTYIVTERSTGILGRRRAITRFTRDRRTASYRPILNRRDADWRLVPNIEGQLFVDRTSIIVNQGQAQFVAVYFPANNSTAENPWPGTKVHISDQTVQCIFPYDDRLINLIAYSFSNRRIRLNETDEDRRYGNSISRWRYELSQFVCERSGLGAPIDPGLGSSLRSIVGGG